MTCCAMNGNRMHGKGDNNWVKFFSEMEEETFHYKEFSGMRWTHHDF